MLQDNASPDGNELVESLDKLADELRVVRDVLDELRCIFDWALKSDRLDGLRCPVVKEMAADPTADNWGEKLRIVRGDCPTAPDEADCGELARAKSVVRELLDTTELNLDDMEDATREVIRRAQSLVEAPGVSVEPESPPCDLTAESENTPTQPGRLF